MGLNGRSDSKILKKDATNRLRDPNIYAENIERCIQRMCAWILPGRYGGGEGVDKEQRWIRQIQRRGSREAADCLVRAYYDEIYRFVYRQVGNKEDALDLTQSIFVAVLRSLPGYQPGQAGFRTWLYAVANNKVIDARRKVQNVPISATPFEELEPPARDDFVSRIQDRMLLAQIESYVSCQSLEQQDVFRLRVYAGRSFPEIAEILGEREEAVKARYYRLIRKIRKEFSDDE